MKASSSKKSYPVSPLKAEPLSILLVAVKSPLIVIVICSLSENSAKIVKFPVVPFSIESTIIQSPSAGFSPLCQATKFGLVASGEVGLVSNTIASLSIVYDLI